MLVRSIANGTHCRHTCVAGVDCAVDVVAARPRDLGTRCGQCGRHLKQLYALNRTDGATTKNAVLRNVVWFVDSAVPVPKVRSTAIIIAKRLRARAAVRTRRMYTCFRAIGRHTQGVQPALRHNKFSRVRCSLYVQSCFQHVDHKGASYSGQHVDRHNSWNHAVCMHCIYTISILRLDNDKNQE